MKNEHRFTKEKPMPDLKTLIEDLALRELRALLPQIGVDSPLNEEGQTVLMLAAQGPSLERLKEVVEAGATIDQTDYFGCTALFYAAEKGSRQNVSYLLAQGADLHLKDNDGETALMKAALAGSEEVVRLLIQKGARVNAKSGFDGTTALMNAAQGCHPRILRYLIRRGAFRRAKDFVGKSAVDWLKQALRRPVYVGSELAFA